MSDPHNFQIRRVELLPIDIPIRDKFSIAGGDLTVAENVFVKIELADGAVGFGEIAPFAAITGETRELCLPAARELGGMLLGKVVSKYRAISESLQEGCAFPAVRCGFETAVLDAFCRSLGIPLWALWGGAGVHEHTIDVTVPIATVEESVRIARYWNERGFRTFKMKVGRDVGHDVHRLAAVSRAIPGSRFVVDANEGYTRDDADCLLREAGAKGIAIAVFEQPIARDDLEGLAWLGRQTAVPIAADESVFTAEDAARVIKAGAADMINVKIMKSGVLAALGIAAMAQASGIQLMIGGMVETRIAMGCSFAIALGLGSFAVLDLDTPVLFREDPLDGGYAYRGERVLPWTGPGLALRPRDWPPEAVIAID